MAQSEGSKQKRSLLSSKTAEDGFANSSSSSSSSSLVSSSSSLDSLRNKPSLPPRQPLSLTQAPVAALSANSAGNSILPHSPLNRTASPSHWIQFDPFHDAAQAENPFNDPAPPATNPFRSPPSASRSLDPAPAASLATSHSVTALKSQNTSTTSLARPISPATAAVVVAALKRAKPALPPRPSTTVSNFGSTLNHVELKQQLEKPSATTTKPPLPARPRTGVVGTSPALSPSQKLPSHSLFPREYPDMLSANRRPPDSVSPMTQTAAWKTVTSVGVCMATMWLSTASHPDGMWIFVAPWGSMIQFIPLVEYDGAPVCSWAGQDMVCYSLTSMAMVGSTVGNGGSSGTATSSSNADTVVKNVNSGDTSSNQPVASLLVIRNALWVGTVDGSLFVLTVSDAVDSDMNMDSKWSIELYRRQGTAHRTCISHLYHIYDHVLSLDEGGMIHIWRDPLAPHNRGRDSPMMDDPRNALAWSPVVSVRISPKQKSTCPIVYENAVWIWTCGSERQMEFIQLCEFQLDSTNSRMENVRACISSGRRLINTPTSVGAICCLTTTADIHFTQRNINKLVGWTGHRDGKLLEWDLFGIISSNANPSPVPRRLIDLGSYRISSLAVVMDQWLWVGFGTGKVAVFSVTAPNVALTPIKEWQAEEKESVDNLFVFQKNLAATGKLMVGSCCKNGAMHLWDAWMLSDFFEKESKLRESEYCEYSPLQLVICSWNLDASKPEHLEANGADKYFLDKWVRTAPDGADIYVFGFQELVDLESKKIAAKGLFQSAGLSKKQIQDHQQLQQNRVKLWRNRLVKLLSDNFRQNYQLLEIQNLVGLFTCIFVKESHLKSGSITNLQSIQVSTGLGGTYGNKGAIVTRFLVDGSSFCFVNAHLPAHQDQVGKRNVDAITILKQAQLQALSTRMPTNLGNGRWALIDHQYQHLWFRGGDGSHLLDHEFVFFSGDLNYRIDQTHSQVTKHVMANEVEQLWPHDQLTKQRLNPGGGCWLKCLNEGNLNFLPTYKYDPGTNNYDTSEKKRIPAWCDRILFRDSFSTETRLNTSSARKPLNQTFYGRFECLVSDHRPIASSFDLWMRHINPEKQRFVAPQIVSAWSVYQERTQQSWLENAFRNN